MNKVLISIKIIFTKIGGWLGWFFGGYDELIFSLVVFVVFDYIASIMCAVVDKKMSDAIGFKGIFKKILIFVLVGVAHILDTCIIDVHPVLRIVVILFYISSEGISLLENAENLGLTIPKKLKYILEQFHNHSKKEDK